MCTFQDAVSCSGKACRKYIIRRRSKKQSHANGIAMLLALSYACPLLPPLFVLFWNDNKYSREFIFRSKYKTPKIHLHQGTIACLQVRNVVLVVVVAGTRFLKTACERSSQNDELDMEALAKLRSIIKVVCTHRFRRMYYYSLHR